MSILSIQHLKKHFGENEILHDISFEVERGDVISVIGSSGSGKSTMLRCINLLETPTDGAILFHGVNIVSGNLKLTEYRSKVSMVFQSFNLFNHLSVLSNCTIGMRKVLHLSKEEAQSRAKHYLEKVGMLAYCNAKPRQLSGGQKQRVAIARALVKRPRVLLLDEPLSNLDARLRLRTREEIKRIQRETGITTVFVTHDQEEAMSISDRIVVMKAGVVQQIGKPQEVYDAPVNLFVARFLGTPPINVFEGRVADGALYIGNDRVLDAPGQPNRAVWVGVRPEGFLPDAEGGLHCALTGTEVMGRDTSIIATHPAAQSQTIRAIINADTCPPLTAGEVHFSLKPHKVLVFDRETEERVF